MKGLFGFIFTLVLLIAHAQQKGTLDTLDYLVIESPMVQKSIIKLPSAYTQLTSDKFISNTGNSVVSSLGLVTGTNAQIGALNTNRITIRGVGSRNPYGTNRVKAYFSGIPISGGDGVTELEDISQDLVSSVEILKGGKSAFYGAGLGGVIILNPIDLAPKGFHGEVKMQIGSDGLLQHQVMLSHGNENTSTILNFGQYHLDGWRENSDFSRFNLFFFHQQKIKNHDLKLIALNRRLDAEIPSSLNYENYKNEPTAAAFTWLSVNGRESNQKNLLAIEDEVSFGTHFSNKLTLFYDWYEGEEYRPFNNYLDKNRRLGLRSKLSFQKQKLAVSLMLETYRELYEWRTYEVDNMDLINHYDEVRLPVIFSLDAGYSISDNWFIESGVSMNFLRYTVLNHATNKEESYDYPAMFSPFIGLSFSVDQSSAFYSNFGHGFSYPSVEETLYPEGIKNPNLLPETGMTFEIGWKHQALSQNFHLDWSVYRLALNNLLLTERIENGDSYGINGGAANNWGTELLFEKRFFSKSANWIHHITISNAMTLGVYQFKDFVNNGEDFSSNHLPGVPNFTDVIALRFKAGNAWHFNTNYQIVGRQFLDDANSEILNSYTVLNANMSYKQSIRWMNLTVNIGLNNIMNEQYSGMVVVNAPAFGNNDPRYFYPAQPRNFSVELKLGF